MVGRCVECHPYLYQYDGSESMMEIG